MRTIRRLITVVSTALSLFSGTAQPAQFNAPYAMPIQSVDSIQLVNAIESNKVAEIPLDEMVRLKQIAEAESTPQENIVLEDSPIEEPKVAEIPESKEVKVADSSEVSPEPVKGAVEHEIKSSVFDSIEGNLVVGELVKFGYYEQDNNLDNGPEQVEWWVIENDDTHVSLYSKDSLDLYSYKDTVNNALYETEYAESISIDNIPLETYRSIAYLEDHPTFNTVKWCWPGQETKYQVCVSTPYAFSRGAFRIVSTNVAPEGWTYDWIIDDCVSAAYVRNSKSTSSSICSDSPQRIETAGYRPYIVITK